MVTVLLSATSVILMVIAIVARTTDPHLASVTFVTALFGLLGTLANLLIPKIQSFLYQHGYRPNVLYDVSVVGDGLTSQDISVGDSGCSFGDGSGCDGG